MKTPKSEVKCPTCGEFTLMHNWILADPEHDYYKGDQRYVCPVCTNTINLAVDALEKRQSRPINSVESE